MITTAELLRRLPKVQLHCHLEGTLRAPTFLELAERYGVSTVYRPSGSDQAAIVSAKRPEDVYVFADFPEFLFTFAAACRSLQAPADYVRLLAEYAQDAQTHSVSYAELFISPSVWQFFNPNLDLDETLQALWAQARRSEHDGGPAIRFIVDITRNFGPAPAMAIARRAVEWKEMGCIGIGLGGDEANFPPEMFEQAFRFARERGLHAVVHAGEAAGAHSVRAAVDVLHAERIGHGIRSLEDSGLIEHLIARRIPLEVCPTSNFRTGVVAAEAVHPLVELEEAGLTMVLDSDDPAMFRTDITAEYVFAEKMVGLDAVLRYAGNAVECSFADASTKAGLMAQFNQACAELLPLRRS